MKKALAASAALFLIPFLAFAQQGITQLDPWKSTSSPYSAITTLVSGKNLYLPFAQATTSALTTTTLCLTGDTCRTTWPTGGSGASFAWPFIPTGYGVSTSTTVGFTNGLLSTASSTFTSAVRLPSLSTGGLGIGTGGLVYSGPTTTFSGVLSYSNGNVTCPTCLTAALTSLGNGLATSTGPAIGIATSSDTNLGLTVTNSGSTFTFTTTWIGTLADARISSAATWNAKQNAITATWPQILTGSTLTFGGLSTTTNLTQGSLPYVTGVNTFGQVATTTLSQGGPITITNGPATVIGGSAMTLGCATCATFGYPFVSFLDVNGTTSSATTSSLHTAGVFTSSSTAATSTLAGGLSLSRLFASATSTVSGLVVQSGGLKVSTLTSCDTVDTDSLGNFVCGTDATGGAGGVSDFTFASTFASLTAATSSKVWFQNTVYASSSIQFNTNTITEHASLKFLDIQGSPGRDYTLMRIKAPTQTGISSKEATLSLLIDVSGDNSGVNEEFIDFYNEHYSDSRQWGLRQAFSGTGQAKPLVFGHWDTAGSKDQGNKLIILPSGAVGIMQATSSVNTGTMLHIASSTATNLLKVDAAAGTNKFLVTASSIVGEVLATFNQGVAVLVSLAIPSGTSPTVDAAGEIAVDTTSDQFVFFGTAKRVVTGYQYPAVSFPPGAQTATTTAATTTIALGAAFVGETWDYVECWSGSGTVGYEFSDGTNKMDFRQATTTASRFALSTNNTYTAGEKRFLNVGPMTASYLSCTVRKAITAD